MSAHPTLTKSVKAVLLIILLPSLIQYSIYLLTRNYDEIYLYGDWFNLCAINDDSIVNTIIAYLVIASVASIIGIVGNLRKAVLGFTVTLLLAAFISVLLLTQTDNIGGVGAFIWGQFGRGCFCGLSFMGYR